MGISKNTSDSFSNMEKAGDEVVKKRFLESPN
jgi:hypothetical protein